MQSYCWEQICLYNHTSKDGKYDANGYFHYLVRLLYRQA
jgi:hypothetical protein